MVGNPNSGSVLDDMMGYKNRSKTAHPFYTWTDWIGANKDLRALRNVSPIVVKTFQKQFLRDYSVPNSL